MLRTAHGYDPVNDTITLGNARTKWTYTRATYRQAGVGRLTDAIFDFAASLRVMCIDDAEYALLTAIAIFSGMCARRAAATTGMQNDRECVIDAKSPTFRRCTRQRYKRTSINTDPHIGIHSRVCS
jgi:hypothetical protein